MDEIKIKYYRSLIEQYEQDIKRLKVLITKANAPVLQIGAIISWLETEIKKADIELDKQFKIALDEADMWDVNYDTDDDEDLYD